MKVLFVCRNNTGRSQVAMEYFNQLAGGADSAGTQVEQPNLKVGDRPGAATILQAMNEDGIDMSSNVRTQLTPDMLGAYDKIIVMAEPHTIPDWLMAEPKMELWEVLDIKDQPIEIARKLRDQIKQKVEKLVAQGKTQ